MRENKFDILEAGVSLVEFYRENPCIAAEDLLNTELPPTQRLMLEDMWSKNFCVITAGRGCGKTRCLRATAPVLHRAGV